LVPISHKNKSGKKTRGYANLFYFAHYTRASNWAFPRTIRVRLSRIRLLIQSCCVRELIRSAKKKRKSGKQKRVLNRVFSAVQVLQDHIHIAQQDRALLPPFVR
jgi:hypothetical protein